MALIRDPEKLEPKARYAYYAAIEELKNSGIRFYTSETLRLESIQYAYHLQGRGHPTKVVNFFRQLVGLPAIADDQNVDGKPITWTIESMHMTGKAVDIYPLKPDGTVWWRAPIEEHAKIAVIMQKHGFEWGGEWDKSKKDPPHYQIKE